MRIVYGALHDAMPVKFTLMGGRCGSDGADFKRIDRGARHTGV